MCVCGVVCGAMVCGGVVSRGLVCATVVCEAVACWAMSCAAVVCGHVVSWGVVCGTVLYGVAVYWAMLCGVWCPVLWCAGLLDGGGGVLLGCTVMGCGALWVRNNSAGGTEGNNEFLEQRLNFLKVNINCYVVMFPTPV